MNSIQELTDIVSGAQLADILSFYANAINANKSALNTKANAASLGAATTRITSLETNSATKTELSDAIRGLNILDKTTRQLVIDYMLPPYRTNVAYLEGQIVRLGGYVFQSKVDGNTSSPYTFISNESGEILVNENWEALILADVNEDNWAQLEEIPTESIPERQTRLETRMTTVESGNSTFMTQMQSWKSNMEATNLSNLQAQRAELEQDFADDILARCTTTNATQLQAKIVELEAQYANQLSENATALSNAQSIIAQQAKVIQNLQNRIAFMDGLTFMVSENNNASDSYTDNNE